MFCVQVGEVLDDRFQIEELLGEGGMGRVWLAIDNQAQDQAKVKVIVKELKSEFSTNKDIIKGFIKEIEALRKITNPQTVTLI